MNLLNLFPVLLLSCVVSAQNDISKFYSDYLTVKSSDSRYVNIEGIPYENEEFTEASVFMNSVSQPLPGKIRYNSYEDQMEFQKNGEGEIQILINQENIDSIQLNNKTFEYRKFLKEKTVNSGYFIKVIDRECTLYLRSLKKLQEEKYPESGYDDYQPASFVPEKDKFYAGFPQLPLIEIPASRRKIPDLFMEHGYVNKEMSRVKYKKKDLIKYFMGLEKVNARSE